MSVIVANEAPLAITITEEDTLAIDPIGVGEDEVVSLEDCAALIERQEKFHQSLDWNGKAKDEAREIER